MTPYQQIEFMVDNGITFTIDLDYENSGFVVSVSRTSAFNYSITDKSMPSAIEKAYNKVCAYIGYETTVDA
jgi:hypothetical protein